MSYSSPDSVEGGTRISPFVRDLISMFLLVGVVFFGVRGVLVLAFQTSSPMMGVSSGSMTHSGGWENYYIERGINPDNFPFQNGLQKGDLVIVNGVHSIEDIHVGDVIVWKRRDETPIIHRVVEVNRGEGYFNTKGDNNPDFVIDERIRMNHVIGEAVLSIPYLGYPSLWTD